MAENCVALPEQGQASLRSSTEVVDALTNAVSALEMIVDPKNAGSSVLNAYAICVEAARKGRAALARTPPSPSAWR